MQAIIEDATGNKWTEDLIEEEGVTGGVAARKGR
jgi:hypothetical protein